jgi:hypothetical protein
MNRQEFLQASVLSAAAAATTENQVLGSISTSATNPQARIHDEQVNFGYAFAPPHRMTVARPEASEKILLDLEAGVVTMCRASGFVQTRQDPVSCIGIPVPDYRSQADCQD